MCYNNVLLRHPTHPMTWSRLAHRAASLAVCGAALGCHGYFPVRAPQRELWVAAPAERPPIMLPSLRADREPGRDDHDDVSVVVKVLEPSLSRSLFQVDLPRHHIQPLLLLLHNGGGETYLFRKAAVDARYLHAEAVARMVSQHPSVTLLRFGKWLAMLLPGLLFETIIEPATTFDFPGIEEAAQRPPPTDNARIREAFARCEIPDGPLARDHTLEGAMFAAGLWFYSVGTQPRDAIGRYGLLGLVALLVVAYIGAAFGPVPPNIASVAWTGIAGGLITAVLGYWIERHRVARD